MSTQIKAKLLQHFAGKKKANGGFTLIELLVVIIIIGILSAIALPSFLNQANKAKQSEAKTYVGSMNRAQQAYYMEEGKFTGSLGDLGLGIAATTDNYKYFAVPTAAGATPVGVTNQAQPEAAQSPVKAYIGGVEVGIVNTTEATTLAVLCEGDNAPVVTGGVTGVEIVTYGAADNAARCTGAGAYSAIN